MNERVAFNSVSLPGAGLGEILDVCEALGISRLGLQATVMDRYGWDRGRKSITESGVAISSLCFPGAFSLGDPDMWQGQRSSLRRVVDEAACLGAASVQITTGPPPIRVPPALAIDRFGDAIGPVLEFARSRGVTICVEHVSPFRLPVGCITSLADLIAVARGYDFGISIEVGSCWTERNIESEIAEAVKRVAVVQVCDYTLDAQGSRDRSVPGDGILPLPWILSEIERNGYEGPYEVELFGERIETEGSVVALQRAVGWLHDTLAAIKT